MAVRPPSSAAERVLEMSSIPNSAAQLIQVAKENDWEVSATFAAGGAGDVKVDTWMVGLEAYTTGGEVYLVLLWERDARGAFRYKPGAGRGGVDGVRLADMSLKAITALVEESELWDGECGCESWEDAEDWHNPRVCIEHAYFPAQGFSARWGWGSEMTRNRDLVGWEDGETGGLYFGAIEGQEALTLADVVPEDVRKANVTVPGLPEPVDVGCCDVRVEGAFDGMCESVGVRLYRVGRQLMCAQHAAQRARVSVSALPVLALDAEERRYAADLIEDDRRLRMFRGAEAWAEQQDAAGRTVPAGFERWTEENWTGDDFAAALEAWLRATGRATDPSFAWAVAGPVDRVEQSAVRLEAARAELETARTRYAQSSLSLSREGMRRARERVDAANVAVAAAERDHAAESSVAGGDDAAAATDAGTVGDRYRFGLPDARGRREVFVDGVLAGYVSNPVVLWYASPLGGQTTEHTDRETAAASLVRWADQRAAEEQARVRAEVADGADVRQGGAVEERTVRAEGRAPVVAENGSGRRVTCAARVGISGCSHRSERVTHPHVTGHVTGRVTPTGRPRGGGGARDRAAARVTGPGAKRGQGPGPGGRRAGAERGVGSAGEEGGPRRADTTGEAGPGRPGLRWERVRGRAGGRGRRSGGGPGRVWGARKNKELI
ncbi:hypothetical protein [Streptomyces sp. NPDC051909]|uniref:hypothetical protein n=1 Tax=Streptomyces sp. NPDC051909 TaxID=3154944 RepID=UPI003449B582